MKSLQRKRHKEEQENPLPSLFTLFISYRYGNHYCGVYPSLEVLRDVVKEMARDMDIRLSEVPPLKKMSKALKEKDDFWHEFSDSTWISISEVAEGNIKMIAPLFRRCPLDLTEIELKKLIDVAKDEEVRLGLAKYSSSISSGLISRFKDGGFPIVDPVLSSVILKLSAAKKKEMLSEH